MGALSELAAQGKIRAAGLSDIGVQTLNRAEKVFPVAAVQNEYSLMTRSNELDAVIDRCGEIGAAFVPYSPVSRGLLTGAYRDASAFGQNDFRARLPRFTNEALADNLQLVDAIAGVAAEKGATPVQIALAWVMARGSHLIPIPGTRRVERVRENAGARDVALSAEDLARIEAGIPIDAIHGARYPENYRSELA